MGFLGGLFGRSSDRKAATTDRCMECGMTGGSHTGWCPTAAAEGAPPPTPEAPAPSEAPSATEAPEEDPGEAAPTA